MENPNTLQLDFGFDKKPLQKYRHKPMNRKKAQDDFVFEFMDCLSSPIIVFSSAWKDDVPKELLDKITMSRLLCSLEGKEMTSLTEVVAYMMPRTFEVPLPSEWCNIYTWCGLQYVSQYKNTKQLDAMKEIAPEKLSDYETGLLNGLRRWIYDKRRKALNDKLKTTKKLKTNILPKIQKELF